MKNTIMKLGEAIKLLKIKKWSRVLRMDYEAEIKEINGRKYIVIVDYATDLGSAIIFDQLEVVIDLINSGYDIETENDMGETALMTALENEIFRPAILGFYQTNYKLTAIKLLINEGANLNIFYNSVHTALTLAIHNNRLDLVKLLIESGADVNFEDVGDKSPLYWSAVYGNIPIMQLLLDAGADIHNPVIVKYFNCSEFYNLRNLILKRKDQVIKSLITDPFIGRLSPN
jgi:ankyrin repeat protein